MSSEEVREEAGRRAGPTSLSEGSFVCSEAIRFEAVMM